MPLLLAEELGWLVHRVRGEAAFFMGAGAGQTSLPILELINIDKFASNRLLNILFLILLLFLGGDVYSCLVLLQLTVRGWVTNTDFLSSFAFNRGVDDHVGLTEDSLVFFIKGPSIDVNVLYSAILEIRLVLTGHGLF